MTERDHWLAMARSTPLAVLADLDGTLLPFAPTPAEARPDRALVDLLAELAQAPGVTAAVVSGRPRETLEDFFHDVPGLYLAAEHGGWRRDRGAWEPFDEHDRTDVDALARELDELAARYPGAIVERKTWSVAFHSRAVASERRDAVVAELERRVRLWIESHPELEALRGAQVLEARPARMDKSTAVVWLRAEAGPRCRLIALGDDVTDEDMFRALAADDESVLVSRDRDRTTAARWVLGGTEEARCFLKWLVTARSGAGDDVAGVLPRAIIGDRVGA
jgi:trehalose-phosphatase